MDNSSVQAADKVPPFATFYEPVLRAIDHLGGSASNDEIDDRAAALMNVPERVRAQPHLNGPRTKFDYRCAWARSWLKNAGLVENSERGVWALTAKGRAALSLPSEEIVRLVRKADADLRKSKAVASAAEPDEPSAPRDWREQLLGVLTAMQPDAFERLCQRFCGNWDSPRLRLPAGAATRGSTAPASCASTSCRFMCDSNASAGRARSAPVSCATFVARWLAAPIRG